MSSETIKEFLVSLGFKVDEAGMSKFSQGIASASLRVTALATAAVAAAGAVVIGVQKIAEEHEHLDKLATQFRTTADAIDEFADTAEILGIGGDTAIEGLQNLDRAIVDTSMGLGRAKLIFEDLGISVTDVAGKLKPTTEVMAELAEKFQGMERGKQIRVMEKLGLDPALLKVFNADMVALRADMAAIDKATGFDLSKAIAESKLFMAVWRKLTQEFNKWKMLFSKAMSKIAVDLMPKLRDQIEKVTNKMVEFRNKIQNAMPEIIGYITPVVKAITKIAEVFIIIADRVVSGIAIIIGEFFKLNAATNGWVGYILAAAAAWKVLNLAFLLSPLGMIVALSLAILLLIDDLATFKRGGKSLVAWGSTFGKVLEDATYIVTGFIASLVLGKVAMAAWAAISLIGSAAAALFSGNVAAAWAVMAVGLAPAILGVLALITVIVLLMNHWDAVKAWFNIFTTWLSAQFNRMAGSISNAFSRAAASFFSVFKPVKAWFVGFFEFIATGFNKIKAIASTVSGFLSGSGNSMSLPSRVSPLTPSPQAQAVMAGNKQSVSQQTNITVQGSGDAAATGRAVSGQQNRVNADMTRNLRGAAR